MNKINPIQTFIIFCLEACKNANNMSGKNVLSKFKKYNVFEFLDIYYDILHTQSMDYIVDEINEYMKNETIPRKYNSN